MKAYRYNHSDRSFKRFNQTKEEKNLTWLGFDGYETKNEIALWV